LGQDACRRQPFGASQHDLVYRIHRGRRSGAKRTEAGDIIVAQRRYGVAVGGAQPGTGASSASGSFRVHGQIELPQ
ncbi:MAG: hypothetical protein ACREU3_18000, partial [Steroidobacteraceae bacterium]